MKVLYCIPQNKIGGAEVVFSSLEETIFDDLEVVKFDLRITNNNPFLYFKAIISIVRIIRNQNINLVISSLWKSHLIVILSSFFCDIKFIPFIHSTEWFNVFDKLISKYILRNSFAVIVDSESVRNARVKYLLHNRVFVVSMRTINSKNRKIYNNFSLNVNFVFVGRITKSKRLDKSIFFLNLLKEKYPNLNITFNVFGPLEESYSEEWNNLILSNYNVQVYANGSIANKDVPNTLLGNDFYLQLSDIEGMSMSVMESMIVGLIPIVTRVGEIGSYAQDNVNAIMCDKDDSIESIVNKFSLIFQDVVELNKISDRAFFTFNTTSLFKDDIFRVLKKITKCVE